MARILSSMNHSFLPSLLAVLIVLACTQSIAAGDVLPDLRATMGDVLRSMKDLPRGSRGFEAARAAIPRLVKNATAMRGAPDGTILNVIIAAHSHCDLGWQVTPPEYFTSEVVKILDSTMVGRRATHPLSHVVHSHIARRHSWTRTRPGS
jgi:hypothetical protein